LVATINVPTQTMIARIEATAAMRILLCLAESVLTETTTCVCVVRRAATVCDARFAPPPKLPVCFFDEPTFDRNAVVRLLSAAGLVPCEEFPPIFESGPAPRLAPAARIIS